MAKTFLKNGKFIGDYSKPYIIAEVNTSHFGEVETAKKMIDEAKIAGCDCVKFQSWSSDTLYSKSYYKKNKIAERIIKKFSLNEDQLIELSKYAKAKEIDFASTPYSIEEALFLVKKCNVPFIKIASMELNNKPFLTDLSRLGIPLILSTGMGSMDEIYDAVDAILSVGNEKLIILHCTSVYPAKPDIIRLNNILGLRLEFPHIPIGFSDHSLGIEIAVAAVALGACVIEKHLTLDKTRIGMDNQMATEPSEMSKMISSCHNVFESLGGASRIICPLEKEQIDRMRRSAVAKKDIAIGSTLDFNNVEFKRPGNGISPAKFESVVGKKANKKILYGEQIFFDDLEQ